MRKLISINHKQFFTVENQFSCIMSCEYGKSSDFFIKLYIFVNKLEDYIFVTIAFNQELNFWKDRLRGPKSDLIESVPLILPSRLATFYRMRLCLDYSDSGKEQIRRI